MLLVPASLESKRSIRQCTESYQRMRKLSGGVSLPEVEETKLEEGLGCQKLDNLTKKNGIKTSVDWNRIEFNRLELV